MAQLSPTSEFYGFLQRAYDHFNRELFGRRLPSCMITVQREKNTMGYFSPNRWINPDGSKKHEIALNSAYFGSSTLLEVFQTLVHEQCHLWQCDFGTPGRSRYHNREWADKMLECGLVPSDTGSLGGKQTGQKMSDYPAPDGRFIQACLKYLAAFDKLPWLDRILAPGDPCQTRLTNDSTELVADAPANIDVLLTPLTELVRGLADPNPLQLAARTSKSKIRYWCEQCGSNVWGKPGLEIVCGPCEIPFEGQNP